MLVDQDRCHGYRFCVEACPYKKVFFDPERQVANKCIFCLPRVEEGVAPWPARDSVPGRLRFVGYLDDREEGPISQAGRQVEGRAAAPPRVRARAERLLRSALSPSASTSRGGRPASRASPSPTSKGSVRPAVRERPRATVEAERAKRKRGEPSELMDLLIAYDWNKSFALGAGKEEVALG